MDELIERLRSAAEAYPEDVFGKTTSDDRLQHGDVVQRAAATMGRHMAPLLREAAAALEAAREDASTERRAMLWLAGGDSGSSSEAICHHMLGMESDGSFPWDPADLGRCLRLLELFPEWKPRIGEMARYSPTWAALSERWKELADVMANEVGIDWSKGKRAPATYAAMKAAIDQARGKENGDG